MRKIDVVAAGPNAFPPDTERVLAARFVMRVTFEPFMHGNWKRRDLKNWLHLLRLALLVYCRGSRPDLEWAKPEKVNLTYGNLMDLEFETDLQGLLGIPRIEDISQTTNVNAKGFQRFEVKELVDSGPAALAVSPLFPFSDEQPTEPIGIEDFPVPFRFWHKFFMTLYRGETPEWSVIRTVATIPEEEWQKGPERIAEVIRGIEAEFQGEVPGKFADEDWSVSEANELAAPEQDALLRIGIIDGKFDILPSHLMDHESEDRVRRTVHQRLLESVRDLARASGNIHPRLAERARALEARLNVTLEVIDPLEVHLDLEDLRATYDRRAELTGEDTLEAAEVDALERIVRLGPGLVRGSDEVERFEERLRLDRIEQISDQLQAAENRIVSSISETKEIAGETLRRRSAAAVDAEASSRAGFARRIISKNAVITIASFSVLAVANKVVGDTGEKALLWLWQHSEAVRILAAERGPSFLSWIDIVLLEVRDYLGAVKGSLPEIRPLDLPEKGDRKED